MNIFKGVAEQIKAQMEKYSALVAQQPKLDKGKCYRVSEGSKVIGIGIYRQASHSMADDTFYARLQFKDFVPFCFGKISDVWFSTDKYQFTKIAASAYIRLRKKLKTTHRQIAQAKKNYEAIVNECQKEYQEIVNNENSSNA